MAQKRMFDKTITNSDTFLELPDSSQVLYFHLSMNADDDGFVNNWKSILKMTGTKEDDLKLLISKSFVIPFESGVIVIKHWRINNYLRNDRYTETKFKEEKSNLVLDDNMVYQLSTDGKPSIDKIRLDKIRLDNYVGKKKFVKPTLQEIKDYCEERNNNINAQYFIDYYESNGWMVGKGKPMKDWKASVRTWEQREKEKEKKVLTEREKRDLAFEEMMKNYQEEE